METGERIPHLFGIFLLLALCSLTSSFWLLFSCPTFTYLIKIHLLNDCKIQHLALISCPSAQMSCSSAQLSPNHRIYRRLVLLIGEVATSHG
jgi:hypothetical protein